MCNTNEPFDLLSADRAELRAYIASNGLPAFRADQLQKWINSATPLDEMSNLPLALRSTLAENAKLDYPKIAEKWVSKIDNTAKYLYELADGQMIESVLMEYEHGNSICLSTQAGCRMGCRFCASTLGGKVRDLTAGEILGQILVAQRDSGKRVSGIVLMGIGEPLDNYDNVLRFLKLVSAPEGLNIGLRHISLSTCGLVDRIKMLAEEDLAITLSISLHASNDQKRSKIMPVNLKWNIDSLLKACRDYFDRTGRRISFEYTLIAGENDHPQDAEELATLLKKYMGKRPFHVNLIPVNPVKERGFAKSGKNSVRRFCAMLGDRGVNATVRRKLGEDINAACGQLRRSAAESKS